MRLWCRFICNIAHPSGVGNYWSFCVERKPSIGSKRERWSNISRFSCIEFKGEEKLRDISLELMRFLLEKFKLKKPYFCQNDSFHFFASNEMNMKMIWQKKIWTISFCNPNYNRLHPRAESWLSNGQGNEITFQWKKISLISQTHLSKKAFL